MIKKAVLLLSLVLITVALENADAFLFQLDIGDTGQPVKTGWEEFTGNHDNNEPPKTYLVDGLSITVDLTVGDGTCGFRNYGGGDLGGDMVYPGSGTGPAGGKVILTLSNLPPGEFSLASYHNDTKSSHDQQDPIDVTVTGAVTTSTSDLGVVQTKCADDSCLSQSTVTFTAAGTGDVVITYIPTTDTGAVSKATLCGFELDFLSTTTLVHFETDSSSSPENSGTVYVTVNVFNPDDVNTVTVNYAVTGGTADGGGVDYTLDSNTLTFLPLVTTQQIEITLVNDGAGEEDETIEITLSNPTNTALGAITQHIFTIQDLSPTVEFETTTGQSPESITPALVSVTLSKTWPETVTVDYSVTGGTAQGGGQDYTLEDGTLSFDPCELTKHISITLFDDEVYEYPDETIEITLSDPNHAKLGTQTQYTFTILPPVVQFCPCGDLDGDCDVDYNDVKLFAAQWLDPQGSCSGYNCANFDELGNVDMVDFALLAENWTSKIFPVVINELLASNDYILEDPCEPNEYPDWVELYNTSPLPIVIGGMYMTDKFDNPTKWKIPDATIIGPWEYLVFYAVGDVEPYHGPTHMDFKLSASGEAIALFDTDGSTLVHSITFAEQVTDVSYGLYPDASENLRFMGGPTPGRANSGAYRGEVSDIQFSHDHGFYDSSFNLSMVCETGGVRIYYTLDGSEPSRFNGTLYSGTPLNISQTTIIRAEGSRPGFFSSSIETQSYIFLDDVVNQPTMNAGVVAAFSSVIEDSFKSIPTLSIAMNPADLVNLQLQDSRDGPTDPNPKQELSASAELIYSDANEGEGLGINCAIEGHSWALEKRSYKLIFKSQFGPSKLDYPFFESAVHHSDSAVEQFDRIVLRASKNMNVTYAGDQWTRDTQTLMSGIGSRGTFVHLYLNGTYCGIYNATERPDASFSSSYLGGEKEDYFATNHGYERGEDHISGDPNRFDNMISMALGLNLEDPTTYETFKGLCDVSNFADYTILYWFSGFGDGIDNNWYAGMRNVPLIGEIPPEGFMIYMWDAESVFQYMSGPPGSAYPWVPYYYFYYECDESPNDVNCTIVSTWVALHENEDFNMLFADRIYKHCFNDGALTDENTQTRWDMIVDDISDAAICERARWPYGSGWSGQTPLPPETVNMTSFVDIFMNALDNYGGLYPTIDPPTFNQHGGAVSSPYVVILTNPNVSGTVYYTLDGTDPREPVTGNPVGTAGISMVLNQSMHVKARVFDDPNWSALNEVTFAVGPVADNLRITEIMYHPLDTSDPNDPNTEYIELKNLGPETINLNLVRFTNGIDFTFPSVSLASGVHVLVVKDQNAFEAKYGTGRNVAGEYSGSLRNSGERIELEDPIGQTIHNFRYSDSWRDNTDGDGYSLTIIDPANSDSNSWDEKDSWRPSVYVNGSPGWDDTGILPNPGSIVINELLAHSDGYPNDWIELHNTTLGPIDISGWFLSDRDSNLMKYQIQSPTIILAGDYIVFTQDANFGNLSDPCCHSAFGLSENGEDVYLSSALDQNGVLTGYRDAEDFGASENGVSFGRYYKSSTDNYNFVAMDSITFGTVNAYPKVGPVVINEIMYHPDWPDMSPYNNEKYEFIELYNISGGDVNLYDEDSIPWKFTDGIEFEFPADANIPAGGYALVVKDLDAFAWRYGSAPAGVEIFGPYDGKCSNSGEKLELSMAGDLDAFAVRHYIRIDRVNYSDGFHPDDNPGSVDLWPTEADGGGKSLSRDTASNYGNDPNNWDPNSPSPGLANY